MALTIENEDGTRTSYYANLAWRPPAVRVNALWLRSDTDFTYDEHRLD